MYVISVHNRLELGHVHCCQTEEETMYKEDIFKQDATLSQGGPRDGCSEKNCESLATSSANFLDILMDLFRSIRKKSCGSGSADKRLRSQHTVPHAVWCWDFPAITTLAGPPANKAYL